MITFPDAATVDQKVDILKIYAEYLDGLILSLERKTMYMQEPPLPLVPETVTVPVEAAPDTVPVDTLTAPAQ